jgi:hypothetical protein
MYRAWLDDNPPMPRAHRPHDLARRCARWILVWFALSIGVATASPVLNPQSMELVCSSGGAMKIVVKSGDGTQAVSSHTLDCPMCAPVALPPPVAIHFEPVQPLAYVLQPIPAAHIAALTAAPLPARGPPRFL